MCAFCFRIREPTRMSNNKTTTTKKKYSKQSGANTNNVVGRFAYCTRGLPIVVGTKESAQWKRYSKCFSDFRPAEQRTSRNYYCLNARLPKKTKQKVNRYYFALAFVVGIVLLILRGMDTFVQVWDGPRLHCWELYLRGMQLKNQSGILLLMAYLYLHK